MILEEILKQITLIKSKTNYSISHIEMSTDKYEEFQDEIDFLSTTQRDNFSKELCDFLLSPRVYTKEEAERYNLLEGALKEKQYIVITNDNVDLDGEIVDLVVIVGKGV